MVWGFVGTIHQRICILIMDKKFKLIEYLFPRLEVKDLLIVQDMIEEMIDDIILEAYQAGQDNMQEAMQLRGDE